MIAIFDIGKTNKKFFIFDEGYKIVFEESIFFQEIEDEDGFACEDIMAISSWIIEALGAAIAKKEFDFKAVNFSAHGASFVHIDKLGNIVTPLYNYFKPFPESLKLKFDDLYNLENICQETCSPELGHLNSGKQLFWLKYEKPKLFHKISYSLHLPEYFCYLLTGKLVSGITSIGCHTMLWDFKSNCYHAWVVSEGLDKKLAPIHSSNINIAFTFQGKELTCGIGLHDSSAALIPYLKSNNNPFVLLSTGTWNISLNPFNKSPLTLSELNQDCLCYLTYKGSQVKATRLFAGGIYEERVNQLAKKFNVEESYFNSLPVERLAESSTNEAEQEYYHLVSDMVVSQKKSTDLCVNSSQIENLIVEGGFAKNKLFIKLLATAYPTMHIQIAEVAQASALGAALIISNKK